MFRLAKTCSLPNDFDDGEIGRPEENGLKLSVTLPRKKSEFYQMEKSDKPGPYLGMNIPEDP